MIVYKNKKTSLLKKNKKLKFSLAFLTVLMIGIIIGRKSKYSLRDITLNFPEYLKYNINTTLKGQEAEKLIIDINFKNYQKLTSVRNKALKVGLLRERTYVNASIKTNGTKQNVKLRLKGDYIDHLQGDKWSFRIKTKGDRTIMGMKQFSLQHPKTKRYIWEYLYHSFSKNENIISLRYNYVNIIINGKNLGLYAIEEHFEKRLIENNQRKNGPIIKFSEDLFWNSKASIYDSYNAAEIISFHGDEYLTDTTQTNQYNRAISLLENYRKNGSKPEEVFDLKLLAKHIAICDLIGAHHALRWHNLRFYYNPITDKLEPISFDGDAGYLINKPHIISYCKLSRFGNGKDNIFYFNLYKDKRFLDEYIKALETISDPIYVSNFLEIYNNDIQQKMIMLNNEFVNYKFDKNILFNNAAIIREHIYPVKSVNAFISKIDGNKITLSFGNSIELPTEIQSIIINGKEYLNENIILEGKKNERASIDYKLYDFILPKNSNLKEQKVIVSTGVIGTKKKKRDTILPHLLNYELVVKNTYINTSSDLKKIPFLQLNDTLKTIAFKSGKHTINENIHIPPGYKVIIPKNTTLNLSKGASIITYSNLHINGDSKNPVKIYSEDKTGEGIFLINTPGISNFNNVTFDYLNNPVKNGWNLSGAITFYNSDVNIENCTFKNNLRGDDLLNLVRSKFLIKNTEFMNSNADALDADYCKGRIENCKFINSGNDGIDTSGSEIELINTNIINASDKAISFGENSTATIHNIVIKDSEIAICAKDKTQITGDSIYLYNNRINFTAFQKKPEFGPAHIKCLNVKQENSETPYLIEKGSSMTLDNKKITTVNVKVETVMYGTEYGKSSK